MPPGRRKVFRPLATRPNTEHNLKKKKNSRNSEKILHKFVKIIVGTKTNGLPKNTQNSEKTLKKIEKNTQNKTNIL